jgi:hypothetical protein
VSPHPISQTPKWAFVAGLAGIRLGFREFDPRLVRGTRLGLAALAAFSFAVAFSAGSRTPRPPQRGLPPTPVAARGSDVGPAVASLFEPVRTLPDLLPAQTVAPTVIAPRRRTTVRQVPARAPTSSSAVPAPPTAQPVRPRIVPQRRMAAAPPPSRPAPARQTFDSSGNTFDSSG